VKTRLAEKLGYAHHNHLAEYANGDIELKPSQIAIIAEFFGVAAPDERRVIMLPAPLPAPDIAETVKAMPPPIKRKFAVYHVEGRAAAGRFLESDDAMVQAERGEPIFADRSFSYPNARHVAWEIEGDSMNELGFFPGSIALGVKFEDIPGLMNGMVVILEQNLGGFRERSLKQIYVYDDRIEFWPRSTNPAHKPIVYRRGIDEAEVSILAVVHAGYFKC